MKAIQTNPEEEIPNIIRYSNRTFLNPSNVTKDIINFYLNGTGFTEQNVESFGYLISDSLVNFAVAHFTHLVRKLQDIFTYRFDYKGSYTVAKHFIKSKVDTGVAHTDELQYLFTNNMDPKYSPGTKEYKIVDLMTSIWYQFAKTG